MSRIRVFLFLLVFVSCGIAITAQATTPLNLKEEVDSLVVGVVEEDNFPLVYFDKDAVVKGFEIAMVRHLAKTGGFELKEIKKFPDHTSLRRALKNQEINFAFSKIKKNATDAEQFIYSDPHLTLEYVFLFNRKEMASNDLQVDPLKKIAGTTLSVATLDNPLYADQLQRTYPGMQIIALQTKEEIFEAVASGVVAACYLDEIEIKSFLLANPDKALYLHYLKGEKTTDSVALIFPWNNLFFKEWVNLFVNKEGYTRTKLPDIMRKYATDLLNR